jgi:bifunctional non-homologous end joining protein LigD
VAGAVDQLELSIEAPGASSRSLPNTLRLAQPAQGGLAFDDPDYFFEPWWPGTRALLYLEGGHLRLQTEHLADPLDRFPELADLAAHFAGDGLIVDGTLLVLDGDGRPDTDLLRRRLADPDDGEGHAAFVASDLLYRDGLPLGARFDERRRQLTGLMHDGDWCVLARGVRGDGETLAEAVASLGLSELSGRRLSARYRPGTGGDAWLRLSIRDEPAPERRPLLALLQRLPL